MGTVFLHGNGGSGGRGGLNFQVVGNPQPSNPKENIIWIDTDVKVTGYEFSATEPKALIDGMVWIITGKTSSIAFNALKKHCLQVYPLSVKQYIGGAWVDKTAKSYQNGEWVDWWNGELYDSGNEFEFVTGGWGTAWTGLSSGVLDENQITLNGVDNNRKGVGTDKCIDLTRYNTLVIYGTAVSSYSNTCLENAGVYSQKNYATQYALAVITAGGSGQFALEIDISQVDEGYICVSVGQSTACKAIIKKIELR